MVTQELINYINSQFQNGQSKETIQIELVSKGWNLSDIEYAFQLISQPQNLEQKVPNANKQKKWLILSLLFLALLILIGGFFLTINLLKQFNIKVNTSVSTTGNVKENTGNSGNNKVQTAQSPTPTQSVIPEGWQKATNLPSSSTHGIAFSFYYPPSPYSAQRTNQLTPPNSLDVVDYITQLPNNGGQSYDQVAQITSSGIEDFNTYVKNAIPFEVGLSETSNFTTSTGLKGIKIVGKSSSMGNTTSYDVILLHTGKTSDFGNEIIIEVIGTYGFSEGNGHGIYNGNSSIIDQIAATISLN